MYRLIRKLSIFTVLATVLVVTNVSADEPPAGGAPGKLTGRFLVDGKRPLADARLFIYNKTYGPPSSDHYVRVPDLIQYLDKDGRFLLELEPGSYYLSAINVDAEAPMGPPAEGEAVYFKMDARGEIVPFDVVTGSLTDAGTIATSAPFNRTKALQKPGSTVIEGIIVDEQGAPMEGAVILADTRPGTQNKALFVSEKTARDGKFRLQLFEGGTYYLRVRSVYHGGMPESGDIVNFNDPKEQVTVELKKGERRAGVTIKVRRQPQKGPLFQGVPLK